MGSHRKLRSAMKIVGAVRCLGIIFLFIVLSGCVAGQTLQLDYTAEYPGTRKSGTVVGVDVKDKRPFVVDGRKKPSYVGHYRAGFGNTWDVHTDDGEALATIIARDLSADLGTLGFKVANDLTATRIIGVTIVDWNFDSYINAKVWYECLVSVRDQAGNALANTTIKDESRIEGSVMVGPKYAVEREMPKVYRSVIRKMVRENSSILQALER